MPLSPNDPGPNVQILHPDPARAGSYPDAYMRALITFIGSRDATISSSYGSFGQHWPSAIPQGESRKQAELVIIDQYLVLTGQSGTATNPFPHPDPGEAKGGIGPIPNPLSGITSVVDFLKLLTKPQTWQRVAEFVVGGILIAVGVSAMLRPQAEKLASKIPAAAKFDTRGKF